jgi:ADP-ribose pyrophosphatase YjhB (NUDIX family)
MMKLIIRQPKSSRSNELARLCIAATTAYLTVGTSATKPTCNFVNVPPLRQRIYKSCHRSSPIRLFDAMTAPLPTSLDSSNFHQVLPYTEGSHMSIKVTVPSPPADRRVDEGDPFDVTYFRQRLENTITAGRQLEKSSLWVEIPMTRASLIEEMVDLSFTFHHAKGPTANLVLWLLESENKIPEYATHQVGVGAMVVNSRNEILCVRELRKNYLPWKVPGGLSELGEHIDEAVVREVMEETGVPCKFQSIISFRHTHNIQFGRSDLYFMCRLEPIESMDQDGNVVIPEPVPQAGEIEKAEWVALQEYKELIAGENGHPMMQHIVKIFEQGADIEQTVLSSVVPGRKPSPVYHTSIEPNVDSSEL